MVGTDDLFIMHRQYLYISIGDHMRLSNLHLSNCLYNLLGCNESSSSSSPSDSNPLNHFPHDSLYCGSSQYPIPLSGCDGDERETA